MPMVTFDLLIEILRPDRSCIVVVKYHVIDIDRAVAHACVPRDQFWRMVKMETLVLNRNISRNVS